MVAGDKVVPSFRFGVTTPFSAAISSIVVEEGWLDGREGHGRESVELWKVRWRSVRRLDVSVRDGCKRRNKLICRQINRYISCRGFVKFK